MQNEEAEFDIIANGYNNEIVENLGVFGRFRETMLYYKCDYLKYILPQKPTGILDYGCGIGLNIPYLQKYFPDAKLYGCDVSGESIKLAKANIQNCEFDVIDKPDDLKIYANKVDCIFISTVLHHIEPAEHTFWLEALYKIMKNGSHMVIFEHNMINPLTKGFVKRIPMDKNATMLKPSYCKNLVKDVFGKTAFVKLEYTYFFPWRNKFFMALEHCLSGIPLGAQYYVSARK
jgi:SAM-dependent methyltransferase